MATAWQVDDIKCITKVSLNVNMTHVVYTINTKDGRGGISIPEKDVDDDQLNSAEFSKLIQNVPGIPKSLNSHSKLENFMKCNFVEDQTVEMDIDINETIGKGYCLFPIDSSYISGIPIKSIVNFEIEHYQEGHLLLDNNEIPLQSQVNFCLHLNLC